MAQITTGLTKNSAGKEGVTTHFAFSYDDTLNAATHSGQPEPARTNALIAACEGDYALLSGWFGGISLTSAPANLSLPISVQVTPASGGAGWGPPITLKPGSNDANYMRYLMVSEVSEMFMYAQGKGWFAPDGSNEQSCGEGLSRFLAQQFLVDAEIGVSEPGYAISPSWLNSSLPLTNPASTQSVNGNNYGSRSDYINNTLEYDNGIDPATGCAMLFIYYLTTQLGYSINSLIAAAPGLTNAATCLRGVYRNLTGDGTDPFPYFKQLLGIVYPENSVSSIAGPNPDNPFPIAKSPQQITPTVLSLATGATSLYAVREDGHVWANFFPAVAASDKWNGWFTLGPNVFTPRTVVSALSNTSGATSLYVAGLDGQVWTNFYPAADGSSKWNGWLALGPNVFPTDATVSVVSTAPGATSLYIVASDGQVWMDFYPAADGGSKWNGWLTLGPNVFPKGATVSSVSLAKGATSLYVMGLDGQVWTNFYPAADGSSKWNGWLALGPNVFPTDATVSVVSTVPGATSLYIVGLDGQVWTNFYPAANGGSKWNGWLALGPNVFPKGAAVSSISLAKGATSLYVMGLDGQVWTNFYPAADGSSKWNGWLALGPNVFPMDATVSVVSTAPGATSLYIVGLDDQVWTNFYPAADGGSKWSGWFVPSSWSSLTFRVTTNDLIKEASEAS